MDTLLNYFSSLPGAVAQGIIAGIMAIGVYITYRVLDVADLTVDGSYCTGAAVCAAMLINGHSVWVAMLVAMLAGMVAGLITGFFHTFMGIPAILSGILTQLMLWSINLKIMGIALGKVSAAVIAVSSRNYKLLASMLKMGDTLLVLAIFSVILIAVLYWFFGTEYGATLRATGDNPQMSRALGINTDIRKIMGLVLSNGIVALAGSLLAQYQGNAEINMGRGAIVTGLAAVIIGEALLGKLTKNNFALKLFAVIVGGIVYFIIYSTIIYLGVESNYLKMLSALVLACFLAVPYWKTRFAKNAKRSNVTKGGS